jgi:carbon-monoxide dehydrogenase medium subunit
MSEISYYSPNSTSDAVKILSKSPGSAKVLSGGTDLLVQLRAGRVRPDLIVDIKNIPGLIGIREENGNYIIGAATPGIMIASHARLKVAWPGVVEAVDLIGSVQVQGRCTLAGNLCNASPAADSVPALFAAGALATIIGPNGMREVAVEQIPTGPGRTSLAAGEFITEFKLPARPGRSADAYLRLTPRTEMDIAIVGCGISVTLDAAGVCTAARVALGAVAPTVILVPEAAACLVGNKLSDTVLANLAAAASAAAKPISDKRGTAQYRTQVAGVLARRCAVIAFDRAASSHTAKVH